MTEAALVSAVALVGWLILVSGSGELRGIGGRRIVRLAGIWAGIFAIVVLIIQLVDA